VVCGVIYVFHIAIIILLIWFLFAITGLSLGKAVLTTRAFDFRTTFWFVLYAVLVGLFFWLGGVMHYIITGFLLVWLIMQGINLVTRSPKHIAGYNKLFENTHHIISPSEKMVIPDTYHLVLISLILFAFATNVLLIFIAYV
jgi:hypothetical protein